MRRTLVALVLATLVAGAATGVAAAESFKAKSPASRTFYVVPGGGQDDCALSRSRTLVDATHGCGTRDDAATGMVLGSEPVWFPALDGLPLRLDVGRSIHGTVTVNSRYLVGWVVPGGAGQAQLRVTVAGVAAGDEVTVGSFTSEPYLVAPHQMEHEVEFRIDPDAALAGATLTDLRLGLEVLGPNVHHNLYYADGLSAVTLPLAR